MIPNMKGKKNRFTRYMICGIYIFIDNEGDLHCQYMADREFRDGLHSRDRTGKGTGPVAGMVLTNGV